MTPPRPPLIDVFCNGKDHVDDTDEFENGGGDDNDEDDDDGDLIQVTGKGNATMALMLASTSPANPAGDIHYPYDNDKDDDDDDLKNNVLVDIF